MHPEEYNMFNAQLELGMKMNFTGNTQSMAKKEAIRSEKIDKPWDLLPEKTHDETKELEIQQHLKQIFMKPQEAKNVRF